MDLHSLGLFHNLYSFTCVCDHLASCQCLLLIRRLDFLHTQSGWRRNLFLQGSLVDSGRRMAAVHPPLYDRDTYDSASVLLGFLHLTAEWIPSWNDDRRWGTLGLRPDLVQSRRVKTYVVAQTKAHHS